MLTKIDISGVIIAGGGQFGSCIAGLLDTADETVTVIDINCETLRALPAYFEGSLVEGDASNIDVLRQAGISHIRAVVAVTDNDNINLMIAQIARQIYEVPFVVAVVSDSSLLAAAGGFDFKIVCPVHVVSSEIVKDLRTKEG